jgi:hypothetical protein
MIPAIISGNENLFILGSYCIFCMTRNFTHHDLSSGVEQGTFEGREPRQAAMKVSKRVLPEYDSQEEAEANAEEFAIREHGVQDKVRVYRGWVWTEETDEDDPDQLGDEKRVSKVYYQRVEELDDS